MHWKLGRDHSNNFDFLRCFFALLVIYSHSYILDTGGAVPDLAQRLTRGQIDGGALALDGFFLISGLLITQSWLHSDGLIDYLRKRVLRIYPGFLFAAVLCVMIGAPLSQPLGLAYLGTLPLRELLRSAANLHFDLRDAFPSNPFPHSIDGSLWTIPYEFSCYLMLAFFGAVGLLRRPAIFLVLFAIVFAAHEAAPANGALRFVCFFLAGSAFCVVRERIPRSPVLLGVALAGLVAAMSLGRGLELALPICGTYALFYFAFTPIARLGQFARYGDFSYGLYLYAFPVQQFLVLYGRDRLPPVLLFLAAALLTFPIAAMSWFLIEKPALALKRQEKDAPVRSFVLVIRELTSQPQLVLLAALGVFGVVDGYFVTPVSHVLARVVGGRIAIEESITFVLFAIFLPWYSAAVLRIQESVGADGLSRRTTSRQRWRGFALVLPAYIVLAAFGARSAVLLAYSPIMEFIQRAPH